MDLPSLPSLFGIESLPFHVAIGVRRAFSTQPLVRLRASLPSPWQGQIHYVASDHCYLPRKNSLGFRKNENVSLFKKEKKHKMKKMKWNLCTQLAKLYFHAGKNLVWAKVHVVYVYVFHF